MMIDWMAWQASGVLRSRGGVGGFNHAPRALSLSLSTRQSRPFPPIGSHELSLFLPLFSLPLARLRLRRRLYPSQLSFPLDSEVDGNDRLVSQCPPGNDGCEIPTERRVPQAETEKL